MTVRQQWLAAALGITAGVATILLTSAPGLGGAILGAATVAGAGASILDRRTHQLRSATDQLDEARRQYEAAHGTLAGQRERMRSAQIEADGRLSERTAVLNAAHHRELLENQLLWFEEGAKAVITGRLPLDGPSDLASIIPLGAHRHRAGGPYN
jgi:hypothetical protein